MDLTNIFTDTRNSSGDTAFSQRTFSTVILPSPGPLLTPEVENSALDDILDELDKMDASGTEPTSQESDIDASDNPDFATYLDCVDGLKLRGYSTERAVDLAKWTGEAIEATLGKKFS